MKEIKKGFTLAEILITISTVGIIAAITIPAIVNISQERSFEAAADRTAVLLEEGIVNVFQRANENNNPDEGAVMTLSATTVNNVLGAGNDFLSQNTVLFDTCGSILGLDRVAAVNENSYKNQVRTAANVAVAGWNTYNVYEMRKINSFITVQPVTAANASTNVDDRELTRIYIDANGDKAPNRMYDQNVFPKGDIFEYRLLNNGHITRVR